jgi:catechol 2,3-dioxygenase-like lactoylglutathione lyase family enzyme
MPGYVAIGVRDLAAARRFWCDGLGLRASGEWPGQLAVAAGGFDVLLDATGEIPVAPGIEIAILAGRADLDRASKVVAPIRGPKDFGGPNGVEAAFRDPNGYVVTLHTGR